MPRVDTPPTAIISDTGWVSLSALLADAVRYVLHVESLLALGVLALLLSLVEWMGGLSENLATPAFAIGQLFFSAYFYLVLHKAASGSRRLPAPSDYLDTWDMLIQPLLQALLSTFWLWAPLLLYIQRTVGLSDFFERYQAQPMIFLLQQGPGGVILLTLGMAYLPLALLAALLGGGMRAAFNPLLGPRIAIRTRWRYITLFAAISLIGLIDVLVGEIGRMLEAGLPIPLVTPVLKHLLCLFAPLAAARLLGSFTHAIAAPLHRGAPA